MPIAAILHHTITSHRTHIQCNMRRITDSEYKHTHNDTYTQSNNDTENERDSKK